jgi:GH15 family glucan-1,4-alpha-glucosidase
MDAFHQARRAGIDGDGPAWDFQVELMAFLADAWRREDDGIWEVRGPRRHFTHSKVMAWVAFDRAVRAVEKYGLDDPVERWRAVRDEIHADVCERGYDAVRGVFTQFYGSRGLDASLLLLPRVGFLPWVQAELDHDGFLLRYRLDLDDHVDGLAGDEGAFLICSFWLVDALHGLGRTRAATELFERLAGLCNDVGLLSEQYDAVRGRLVGNIPQAFSHIGLINAARHLSGFSTGA